MTQQEFYNRTGVLPDADEWWTIHDNYMAFNGDKNQFCRAWKRANLARVRHEKQARIEAEQIEVAKRYAMKLWERLHRIVCSNGGSTLRIAEVATSRQMEALKTLGINTEHFCADPEGTALCSSVYYTLTDCMAKW